MSYDVLVVKSPQNGYMARLLAWPSLVAHGQTRHEVLAKMQESLNAVWSEGEVVQIDMPSPMQSSEPNPWLKNFGRFKDDPTFDDLLEEIANYRHKIDLSEDVA